MKEEYSIFRKFSTLEQAKELEEILKNEGIESILADNVPPVDVTFSGNTLQNEIEIRISQSHFNKAEQILEHNAEKLIDQVEKDYYLFEFTDEELYEVLLKSDEWNKFDYTLAKKILKKRGKSIDQIFLNTLKKQRLSELSKPDQGQKPWIIAGYIFSFLGGLLGLIIGYFLWTQRKTLPNGQKVYAYKENDRKHGKYIFYIGLICFPTYLIWKLIELT